MAFDGISLFQRLFERHCQAVVQDGKGHYSPAHGLRAATQVQPPCLELCRGW